MTDVDTGGFATPPFESAGMYLGQPCLLMGYAIEHSISVAGGPDRPFPVVKSGVVAAMSPETT